MRIDGKDLCVVGRFKDGRLDAAVAELLYQGRKLSDKINGSLHAVIFSDKSEAPDDEVGCYGADLLYNIEGCDEYTPDGWVDMLEGIVKENNYRLILCEASVVGNDLAARSAARLRAGIVSNCQKILINNDKSIRLSKATHRGKVTTNYENFKENSPLVVSLKSASSKHGIDKKEKKVKVVSLTCQKNSRAQAVKRKKIIKGDPKLIDIADAELIVAGGNGLGSHKGFSIIQELAEVLGASVAGSRMATDAGWLKQNRLVGQTGKKVSPVLYMACGISGASHHLLGMKDSDMIVAINTDRNAPIMKMADVAIVGDLHDIIPQVVKIIKNKHLDK